MRNITWQIIVKLIKYLLIKLWVQFMQMIMLNICPIISTFKGNSTTPIFSLIQCVMNFLDNWHIFYQFITINFGFFITRTSTSYIMTVNYQIIFHVFKYYLLGKKILIQIPLTQIIFMLLSYKVLPFPGRTLYLYLCTSCHRGYIVLAPPFSNEV